MISKTYTDGVILTIRRPNGQVEEVEKKGLDERGVIPRALFAKLVAANKDAGRGDVLSQRPNVKDVPLDVQRMQIVGKIRDWSDRFPSQAKNNALRELQAALDEFDAQHPEVVAAEIAARQERTAAGVNRALNMED